MIYGKESRIRDSSILFRAAEGGRSDRIHANEQLVWMLKGRMEFRLGSEQRVCSQGDIVVIPGGTEHEG
jgi:quercetin dioxygenase-like cupin family protein